MTNQYKRLTKNGPVHGIEARLVTVKGNGFRMLCGKEFSRGKNFPRHGATYQRQRVSCNDCNTKLNA